MGWIGLERVNPKAEKYFEMLDKWMRKNIGKVFNVTDTVRGMHLPIKSGYVTQNKIKIEMLRDHYNTHEIDGLRIEKLYKNGRAYYRMVRIKK